MGDVVENAVALSRLSTSGVQVAIGPFLVHVRSELPLVRHYLEVLYADFSFRDDPGGHFDIQVAASRGVRRWIRPQANLTVNGERPFLPLPANLAGALFEWTLNFCVGREAHRFVAMHAAVVERGGKALIISGESGAGKSLTARAVLQLLPQAASVRGGQIVLDGVDLLQASTSHLRGVRGAKVGMILQDPMSSLNPVFSIGRQVREPVAMYHGLRGQALGERAAALLAAVRIPSPVERLRAFPHQLSGGMRQRVVGAMAIAAPPRLLIADEPTTSLDLTIQSQYLSLLEELQRRHDLAMIFITHNFGIVSRICDRVAVMYAGRIAEMGMVRQIFTSPAHPYTRALLESIPRLGARTSRLAAIEGQPPDMAKLPGGCAFAPRCPHVMDRCRGEAPPEFTVAPGQVSRCWLHAPA